MPASRLIEGLDYYTEGDRIVFTAHFHRQRGYCCNSRCRHCPYRKDALPSPEGVVAVSVAPIVVDESGAGPLDEGLAGDALAGTGDPDGQADVERVRIDLGGLPKKLF